MKKFLFVATMLVALVATVVSCNQKKEEAKAPEAIPIGKVALQPEINGTDTVYKIIDPDTKEPKGYSTYRKVEDKGDFLFAYDNEGIRLLSIKGVANSCVCDTFEVKTLYATTTKSDSAKWLKVKISNGNNLGLLVKEEELPNVTQVEGTKDDVILLDNGYHFFKQKGKWGVAKNGESEALIEEASQVAVVTTAAGKIYFFAASAAGSGLYDEKGHAVKYATPKTIGGKELWREGPCFARVVNNI